MFEKDHALSRRFQKIDVIEPSVDETIAILKGLKSRFEAHHGVKYSADALTAAAELSARYINDRHLPDKAIDVIDEAGAAQSILPEGEAEAHHRQARDRGDHRQDRAHSAADGVDRRPQRAEEPRPRPEGRGVRPGQGDRRARRRRSRWRAAGLGQSAEADRQLPVLRARPASARPRSRASSPTSWASS